MLLWVVCYIYVSMYLGLNVVVDNAGWVRVENVRRMPMWFKGIVPFKAV